MSINVIGSLYDGGQCSQTVQVTDANDLLDLGLGQYIMDHVPDQLYYIPGSCGLECEDGNGKKWRNCEGWINKNTGSSSNNKKKVPIGTILVIAAVIGFLIIYFLIKKRK